ncbi:hypothetical protein K9M59_01380 [Candidatus Gracilibacteria bacterium]|nr:hypothetical protein [Candidatus Gracilibacteria bacterium]MCF7819220.1 hypothetical protein [Candidatus Gracilibacteria bacterium]
MKFSHFREIVHKICEDVVCPRCQADFEERDIEVQNAEDRNIDFYARCEECGAEVLIAAHIQPVRSALKKSSALPAQFPRQHRRVGISRDKVQNIIQTLQTFRGKDVRELF